MIVAIHKDLLTYNVEIPGVIIFNKLEDIPKSNTFFFSKPYDCDYLKKSMYGIVSYFRLDILDWLPFLETKYINFNSYFKVICQLNSEDIGKYYRANNNDIAYTGSIINDKIDLKFIKEQHQQDELILLSDKKNITQKIRLWIINERCITYSKFDNNNNESYIYKIDDYIKFAEKCMLCYTPDDMFTMDIGVYNQNLYIIKYNCFSTSYLYNADICKLYKELNMYFNS